MRTEIVRCDACAEVLGDGTRALVIMLAEATIVGAAPTRAAHPLAPQISCESPIELCMSCAAKPVELLPYVEAARKRYAEREAAMLGRRIEGGGFFHPEFGGPE